MKKIPFSKSAKINNNLSYINQSLSLGRTEGNSIFSKKVEKLIENKLLNKKGKAFLTPSCTAALELSAILLDFKKGDEVIIPSFTFVSTALAYYMNGAKIVFSDIRPDTLNIDESKLEGLITKKTKAIVVVHYAGVSCEMDTIMEIAKKYKLIVIEDNAHGIFGKYKKKPLGSIGHFSTFSFHSTKNLSCGEGGALVINDFKFIERAHTIREKGTNRHKFVKREISKYTWVDKGSSFLLSDLLSAMLYQQFKFSKKIQNKRKEIWNTYQSMLTNWAHKNNIKIPYVPKNCKQSYHMFYLLFDTKLKRNKFKKYLSVHNIEGNFHYEPLHLSKFAIKNKFKSRNIKVSKQISECIIRLPFFYNIKKIELDYIIEKIKEYRN